MLELIKRELVGPRWPVKSSKQSLAEMVLPPGVVTDEHYHRTIEEIYFVAGGTGTLWLEGEEHTLKRGDHVVISPGVVHKLSNDKDATEALSVVCCCVPPYIQSDTVFTQK